MNIRLSHLESRMDESRAVVATVRDELNAVDDIAGTLIETLSNGGTIFTAGNGGSAAQAMHLAEELVGRYRGDRRPLAANYLGADTTAMTCIANDFGFEQVFSRPIQALAGPGDALVVLSTSGNSANITAALSAAGALQCTTIGLLGGNGGEARSLCDRSIVIDCDDSAHVQDAHQLILHLFCEALDQWALETQS